MSEGDNHFQGEQHQTIDLDPTLSSEQSTASSGQSQNNQDKSNIYDDEIEEEEIDDLPFVGDETLVDMFSYYFIKYMDEANQSSPSPSYFAHLSNDEKSLLRIFKQYYGLYKNHK